MQKKINLDDAIALQNFLYTGVEALSPEAIYENSFSIIERGNL